MRGIESGYWGRNNPDLILHEREDVLSTMHMRD
jgi:hypothetical protein